MYYHDTNFMVGMGLWFTLVIVLLVIGIIILNEINKKGK